MHHSKLVKTITRGILTAGILILLCCMLTGCAGSSGKKDSRAKAGTIVSESDESITFIDQAGREVTVPARTKESIATSYRVTLRFIITLGAGDQITGAGKTEPFLYMLQPSLKEAVDVGKGVPDLEAIAQLKPDVFFHRAVDADGLDSVQELGIPAVGLSFETPEEMKTALTIMGIVLDKRDRADELIAYYDRKTEEDRNDADQIKDRKTAIVMGSSIGTVANGGMLQSEMIELAGGINPAAELKASELWPVAGTEQIFKWDPDYIFVTGSEGAEYTPEDIYNDSAWSQLKAVREKHVFRMPAEMDSWEFPGVVSVLGVDYMKSRMYPDRLSEQELQDEIDQFYQLSYGRLFSSEEIGY